MNIITVLAGKIPVKVYLFIKIFPLIYVYPVKVFSTENFEIRLSLRASLEINIFHSDLLDYIN